MINNKYDYGKNKKNKTKKQIFELNDWYKKNRGVLNQEYMHTQDKFKFICDNPGVFGSSSLLTFPLILLPGPVYPNTVTQTYTSGVTITNSTTNLAGFNADSLDNNGFVQFYSVNTTIPVPYKLSFKLKFLSWNIFPSNPTYIGVGVRDNTTPTTISTTQGYAPANCGNYVCLATCIPSNSNDVTSKILGAFYTVSDSINNTFNFTGYPNSNTSLLLGNNDTIFTIYEESPNVFKINVKNTYATGFQTDTYYTLPNTKLTGYQRNVFVFLSGFWGSSNSSNGVNFTVEMTQSLN